MDKRTGGDVVLSQGYGLMPNYVLFNNDLTDKQKLLYCLISSLCAEKGYCWATNEYLGELLNANKTTISKNISALVDKGLIYIDINQNYQRKLTLVKNDKGDSQKGQGGDSQKGQDNITSINTTTEKKENKKEKKGYGEFGLCYLTDSEYSKIVSDYGLKNGEYLIKQVDNYCARKGKKYKNYAAAVRQFADSAGIKKIQKQTVNESGVYDLPF